MLYVLSRISAALSKFVSPIRTAASSSATGSKEREKNPFERFDPKKRENKDDSHQGKNEHATATLKAVPSPQESSASEPKTQSAEEGKRGGTLLHLFGLIRQSGSPMAKQKAQLAYRDAQKRQKKNVRFRKGTIIDEKAG